MCRLICRSGIVAITVGEPARGMLPEVSLRVQMRTDVYLYDASRSLAMLKPALY